MKGRKKTPSELKITRGTNQPIRMNPHEPKIKVEHPPTPDWLSERAQKLFMDLSGKLVDMRLISKNDGLALELLADAYDEYRKAREIIDTEGLTHEFTNIKSGVTTIRAHPAVGIANNAWRRVLSMLSEFGLTPAARAKVGTLEPGEEDPLQRLLKS